MGGHEEVMVAMVEAGWVQVHLVCTEVGKVAAEQPEVAVLEVRGVVRVREAQAGLLEGMVAELLGRLAVEEVLVCEVV